MNWIFGLHFKSSKIRNDFRNSAPERAASQLLLNLTNFPDNLSHFINKLCGSSSPLVLNSAHTVSLIEGDILILQKSQNCVEQSLFLIEGILDGFWQHFGISSTFKKIMGRVVTLEAFSKMSQITSVFKILPTRPAVLLRENLSKLPDLEEEALTALL